MTRRRLVAHERRDDALFFYYKIEVERVVFVAYGDKGAMRD